MICVQYVTNRGRGARWSSICFVIKPPNAKVVDSAGRKTTPHTLIAHVKLGAEIDERGARARRAGGPVRQLVALEAPDADGRGRKAGEGGGEEDPRAHEVAGHFVA